jgi:hypothetical protein
VRNAPSALKYEPGPIVADGDYVIVHGRFSGFGLAVNWIAVDILHIEDGILELIPKYFEPEVLTAVVGGREIVTELLELPFDFIFLTGSVGAGKAVMKAAAEHLTPVLLELGGQNPAIVDETANLPYGFDSLTQCPIYSRLTAQCGNRSLVPALYEGKGRSTQPVV